jgi:hypothetical protein
MLGSVRQKLNKTLIYFGFEFSRRISETKLREALEFLRPRDFEGELIRVGPSSDGGYVVPSEIGKVDFLLSPGSNGQWDFEKAFFKSFNVPSIILDTVEKKPHDLEPPHQFINTWIGSSNSAGIQTLSTVLSNRLSKEGSFVLQMDIEGMEYESILALEDAHLKRSRVMIVELHYLENLMNPEFVKYVFVPFMTKLMTYHEIVFINGNTYNEILSYKSMKWPRVLEITAVLRGSDFRTGSSVTNFNEFANLVSDEGGKFKNHDMYWFSH